MTISWDFFLIGFPLRKSDESQTFYLKKSLKVVPASDESTTIAQSMALAKSRMRCSPKPDLIPTTSLSSYSALNCSWLAPDPLSVIDK